MLTGIEGKNKITISLNLSCAMKALTGLAMKLLQALSCAIAEATLRRLQVFQMEKIHKNT